jgi:hypothetical protein
MKNFNNLIFFIVLFLALTGTSLKAQFSISGEFRPRFEYRDGYLRLRDSSQTGYPTIQGRNRLIFDYANEPFTARFSVQQAYVFGENNYSSDTITRNTINIYEAWFRYAFAKKFAFKVGRTELIYDDGRLLGNSNWAPKGATHDVAIFQWEGAAGKYKGDFGFAINNAAPSSLYLEAYPLRNYKYMGYLYEQRKLFNDQLTISFLGILDVFQKASVSSKTTTTSYTTGYVVNSNNDTIGTIQIPVSTSIIVTSNYPDDLYGRGTIGGTIGYSKNKLKIFGAGYYQGGHFKDGRKLNAGFIGGTVSYQFVKPFTFLVGYDYFTGNNYSKTEQQKTKSTAFSTLYSSSHSFYGYMDLFNAQLATGLGPGLTDLYAKATLKTSEKTTFEATFRYFSIPHGYLPATKAVPSSTGYLSVDKTLGSEIDLMATYKPVKNFEINGAYCFFLPTETMEIWNGLKPGTSQWVQYAYIMLTWKPNFFTSEKR